MTYLMVNIGEIDFAIRFEDKNDAITVATTLMKSYDWNKVKEGVIEIRSEDGMWIKWGIM